MAADEDFLDGCDLDFTEDPDDALTQSLRPLFPQGRHSPVTEEQWREVFGAGHRDS